MMRITSWLLASLAAGLALNGQAQELLIERVTVLSSERSAPLADADVLIRDGRIVRVGTGRLDAPATTRRLDGRGKFLTPGLMDSHVHVSDAAGLPPQANDPKVESLRAALLRQQPRSYLYVGITQVLDLHNTPQGIAAFESQAEHPDIFRCGGAPVVGGYPTMFTHESASRAPDYLFEPVNQAAHPMPDGDDPAAHTPEAVVERIAASGAICVKVFIEDGMGPARDWPLISGETLSRTRAAAHRRGLLLVAHANAIDMQRIAAASHVDVIAHGLWHWLDASTPSGMPDTIAAHLRDVHARGVGYQPTLRVLPSDAELFDSATLDDPVYATLVPAELLAWYRTDDAQFYKSMLLSYFPTSIPAAQIAKVMEPALERNLRATRYLHELGHPLLLASDTPSAATYAAQPGYNTYRELQLMARAGIPLPAIFAAGTINNARQFRLEKDYGTVEPGKIANLLLLEASPLETVNAWDRIDKIILHGKVIDRESLAVARAP